MNTYRVAFLNLIFYLLVLGGLTIGGFLAHAPLWVGISCIVLIVVFLIFQYQLEYIISDQEIRCKLFGRESKVKWNDIVGAYVRANPDFPSDFCMLRLVSSDQKHLYIFFRFLKDSELFLRDVVAHFPPTCEVDPNLTGLVKEGNKYKWKVFLKTDGKSLLWGGIIIFALLLVLWSTTK